MIDEAVLQRFRSSRLPVSGNGTRASQDAHRAFTAVRLWSAQACSVLRAHATHPASGASSTRACVCSRSSWPSALPMDMRPDSVMGYRSACRHVLVWLHQSRIPMRRMDGEVLARFVEHDCVCPGPFESLRKRLGGWAIHLSRRAVLKISLPPGGCCRAAVSTTRHEAADEELEAFGEMASSSSRHPRSDDRQAPQTSLGDAGAAR